MTITLKNFLQYRLIIYQWKQRIVWYLDTKKIIFTNF